MKASYLILALVLSVFVPQAHAASWLIGYLLAAMLFLSFASAKGGGRVFDPAVLTILVLNLAIGFLAYAVFLPLGKTAALAALMVGLAPTAVAAPVITGFLGGSVSFTATAMLISNMALAVVLPFALAFAGNGGSGLALAVLKSTALVVLLPACAAVALRTLLPGTARRLGRFGPPVSFTCWLGVIFIAGASSSQFIRTHNVAPSMIALIALISLLVCAVSFGLGKVAGGRTHCIEASQSLGQKNTGIMVWASLTFVSPVVALAPVFYMFFHSVYNSWQIWRHDRAVMRESR